MKDYQELLYPKVPRTDIVGQPCGSCNEPLPDSVVHHVVFPGSPEMRLAEEGLLNSLQCSACGFLGFFTASSLIVHADRGRLLFIIPNTVPLFNLEGLDRCLRELAQAKPHFTIWKDLPCQTMGSASQIPGLLEVPDERVYLDGVRERQRISRLGLPLELRARLFVTHQIELLNLQVAKRDELESVPDSGFQIEVHNKFSIYEQTSRCLTAFRDAVNNHAPENDGKEYFELVVQSLDSDIEDARSVALQESEKVAYERHDDEKTRQYDTEIKTLLGTKDASLLTYQQLFNFVLNYHFAGDLLFSMDLAECYLTRGHPTGESNEQVFMVVGLFGFTLERLNSLTTFDALPYLDFAMREGGEYLPPTLVARLESMKARYYKRVHENYRASVYLSISAAKKLIQVEEHREAGNLLRDALLTSDEMGDVELKNQAIELLNSLPGSTTATETESTASDRTIEKFDLIYNMLPNGPHWASVAEEASVNYGSIIFKKIPINYSFDHELELYEELRFRVEGYGPHRKEDIEDFEKSMGDHYRTVVVRVWDTREASEEVLDLHFEQIMHHPLLVSAPERSEPDELRNPDTLPMLVQWAGQNRLAKWLLNSLVRSFNEFGDPLPIKLRLAYGAAFSGLIGFETPETNVSTANIVVNLLGPTVEESDAYLLDNYSPSSVTSLRRNLAKGYEVKSDFTKALDLYKKNLDSAVRVRNYNQEDNRLAIRAQQLAGSDVGRYFRCLLSITDWSPNQEQLSFIAKIGEQSRSRYLASQFSEPDRLAGASSNRLFVENYAQMWLVTSLHETEGAWVWVSEPESGVFSLSRIDWDVPLRLYRSVDGIFANRYSSQDKKAEELTRANEAIRDGIEWVRSLIELYPGDADWMGVSPKAYLLNFPWCFFSTLVGMSEETQGNRLLSRVFSSSTMRAVTTAPFAKTVDGKMNLFVNPLGDLPELDTLKYQPRGDKSGANANMFKRMAASNSMFLDAVVDSDCLVYIGHGKQRRDLETTNLVFSFGREVTETQISECKGAAGNSARVAIVLACWGGASAMEGSLEGWEAQGLPYAFKSAGYDFVITSIWPLSPDVARFFVETFLAHWDDYDDCVSCFCHTYRDLISEFGIDRVIHEGGGIELVT